MIVFRTNNSLVQNIILIILLIALAVAGFFATVILLPIILVIGVYFWYRIRKTMKNAYTESTTVTYEYTSPNEQEKEQQAIVYDIPPEDYTVEEKK